MKALPVRSFDAKIRKAASTHFLPNASRQMARDFRAPEADQPASCHPGRPTIAGSFPRRRPLPVEAAGRCRNNADALASSTVSEHQVVSVPVSKTESQKAAAQSKGGTKRQRSEARRRVAQQRATNSKLVRFGLLSLVVIVPGLWWFDHTGPQEIVDAEVVDTQRYNHVNQASGPHTHIRATLLIDGRAKEVIPKADRLERGQHLEVWIRRGRLTNYPYYFDLVKTGELMSTEGGG